MPKPMLILLQVHKIEVYTNQTRPRWGCDDYPKDVIMSAALAFQLDSSYEIVKPMIKLYWDSLVQAI